MPLENVLERRFQNLRQDGQVSGGATPALQALQLVVADVATTSCRQARNSGSVWAAIARRKSAPKFSLHDHQGCRSKSVAMFGIIVQTWRGFGTLLGRWDSDSHGRHCVAGRVGGKGTLNWHRFLARPKRPIQPERNPASGTWLLPITHATHRLASAWVGGRVSRPGRRWYRRRIIAAQFDRAHQTGCATLRCDA